MARPVKWSRDLHLLRDSARNSRTETWSRQDIERLFAIGRASAQSLMKAIGEVQTVGAAHFVDRHSLMSFLDDMISAESVEQAMRDRLALAEPPPKRKLLRTSLPGGLRQAMLPDLPPNVTLSPGRIEITGASATTMVEALISLAMVMQNDLARWEQAISIPTPVAEAQDDELRMLFRELRNRSTRHNDA
jgi:hypothetical protein